MQAGETVVADIKRHPIGIIAVYVGCGLLMALVALLVFSVLPSFGDDTSGGVSQIGAVILLALGITCILYALIATKVYWGNRWIVTTDSITQVDQRSLFHRQSSQLSLGNIEDVTAEQNGVLTHIFGYGVVKVETAGEHSKFQFLYCPNPNYYAQQILATRETFEQIHRQHQTPPAAQGTNINTA